MLTAPSTKHYTNLTQAGQERETSGLAFFGSRIIPHTINNVSNVCTAPDAPNLGNILRVAQPVSSEPNEWALAVESIAADLADNSGRLNPAAVEDIGVIVHYTLA